jgi:hypothetical protein
MNNTGGGGPAQPLNGQFGRRGTGALAIGDAMLKGFMQGHKVKEQRKQAQAEAMYNSAQAAIGAARDQYQQKIDSGEAKPNDEKDPAFIAYKGTTDTALAGISSIMIPDKTQKGKKSASGGSGSTGGKDKKQASAGFSNIRDFLAANQHIVPQLALMTMQARPLGQTQQGKEQNVKLQEQQQEVQSKQQAAADSNMVALYGSLDEKQQAILPPEVKKQVFDVDPETGVKPIDAAKGRIEQRERESGRGTPKEYSSPDGSRRGWYVPGRQPEGWNATAGSAAPKAGSDAEAEDKFLKEKFGVTRENATTEQLTAARQQARADKTLQTATTSTSSTTPQGDRKTTATRKATPVAIQPPPAASRQASPASAGISKPPTAKASPTGQGAQGIGRPPQAGKTAKAGITPPPGGKQTALTASVTRQATQKQKEGYRKAENQYKADLAAADKAFAAAQKTAATGDPSILEAAQQAKDAAYTRAKKFLDGAKQSVAEEYDSAVKSIGGTTGGQQQGTIAIQAPDGNTYTFPDQKSADAFKQAAGIK